MENCGGISSDRDLLEAVNRLYAVGGTAIRLHRESAGRVYYVNCPEDRVVLKLYRPTESEAAIRSTGIIRYLSDCDFPVVAIVRSVLGNDFEFYDMPEGRCVGVLFEFAKGKCIGFLHRWRDGKQPLVHPKAALLGRAVGRMHRLMEGYRGDLPVKGRKRYIDDLIFLMERDECDPVLTRDFREYGDELWNMVDSLPAGFCHGDMHTGNTAYRGGVFTWMDFDRASVSHPVIDVGWLTDGSDFNRFDDGALDRTRSLFDALYEGYARERPLSDGELRAVFPSVAIIHYDLISSIVLMKGERLEKAFVDEQHGWLMRWRELCARINW